MTDEEELWEIEERLWLSGAEVFRSVMDEDAVMVFPVPAGILRGKEVLEGLDGAPRWRTVEMRERNFRRRGEVAVLAYRASAEREGAPLYEALCASTYLNDGGTWRLVAHQQTPVG